MNLVCPSSRASTTQFLVTQYGIRSIPTMILFRGGMEIDRVSGAMGAQQIVAWLDRKLHP